MDGWMDGVIETALLSNIREGIPSLVSGEDPTTWLHHIINDTVVNKFRQ